MLPIRQQFSALIYIVCFRLTTRLQNSPIIYLLHFNGNLIIFAYAIKISGFGTSDHALYVIHVASINIQNLLAFTNSIEFLPQYKVRPFPAGVVLFEFKKSTTYVLCCFRNSNFAQLIPLKNFSF